MSLKEEALENSWRMRAYQLALAEVSSEGRDAVTADAVCRGLRRELDAVEVAITIMSSEPTDAIIGESTRSDGHLSDLEVTVAEGPASDAVARRHPCLVPHLDAAFERWPGYVSLAREREVGSVFAFPLGGSAVPMGAITIYMSRPDALNKPQLRLSQGAAEVATRVLFSDRPDLLQYNSDECYRAREGRSEVYQAQGMVGVELHMALPEAIALMRAHAFATGMTLTEVAGEIVRGRVSLRSDQA